MRASTAEEHYDARACGAKQKQGDRSELQQFHNAAKRALLAEFATGSQRLLDLACGRGGDIHKWRSQGIPHVTGLDISSKSIDEARDRLRASAPSANYHFEQTDLRKGCWQGDAPFDVVTCMFALHFFFESESAAHALLKCAAANLKPGGVFLGIVPDGLQVNELIRYGPFDNGVLRVQALWQGKPACFGSAYTCSIAGTVTEGSQVPEYLVYASVLQRLASLYGFEPVPIRDGSFDATGHGGFHRLQPPYNGLHAPCSTMYAAFAFRKSTKN